jgi:signal transduction histidine kinase
MDIILLSESIEEDQRIDRSVILIELQSIVKLVDDSIQTIRNIAAELRPDVLDHLGLIEAIEWQAKEFQGRNKIKCNFKSDLKNIVLDKDRTTAIFRVFQETLTNVIRHANSTKVDVALEKYNGNLLLRVEDNGKGISDSEINNIKSIGIIGMRERSFIIGGELNIKGKKGRGTVVTLEIPLAENIIESIN